MWCSCVQKVGNFHGNVADAVNQKLALHMISPWSYRLVEEGYITPETSATGCTHGTTLKTKLGKNLEAKKAF